MPTIDGTIYIDTKIKTSGLDKDVAEIESKLKAMHEAERNSKQDSGTNTEYADLSRQLAAAEKEAARLDARFNSIVDKEEKFVALGGDTSSKTFQGYEYDLEKTGEALKEAQAKVDELKSKMASMPSSGADGIQKEGQAANTAATPVEKLSNATKNLEKETGKASKSTKLLHGNFKLAHLSAGKLFKTVLKYVFGIRSVFMLIRKIRAAVKEGFKNFAQVDDQTNKSISALKSSLSQLKNSFAVAFAPILNTVAPILNKLIQMIATAMNYISMFFAALSGASTYNAAKYNYEDYAESLDKVGAAAQRNLSGLDEMNIWQTGGGGGGSGVDASDMFEKLPVEFAEGSFFDRFISAIKNGDWAEVGVIMGQKFNQIVDDIGWYDLGAKLGKKLTNLVTVAYNFLAIADFEKLGKGLADSVNGFIVNTDWELTARTLGVAITDILDAAIGFIENFDFKTAGKAISNFVYGLIDKIAIWIARTDWGELTQSIQEGVINLIDSIDGKKFGGVISKLISSILKAAASSLKKADVGDVIHAITELASDIISGIDIKDLAKSIWTFAKSLIENIIATIPQVAAELSIVNVTSKLLEGVFRAIGWNAGADFVGGISDFITGAGKTVKDWIRNFFSDDGNSLENGFGGSGGKFGDQVETHELSYDVAVSLHGRLESITLDNEDESTVYLAQKLVDDIYALNAVSIKTPEQIDEIITKCQMLNELGLDGITIEYDELTGEIKTQRSELEKLIKEYKKQLEVEALSEAYKEAYKTKVEAERTLEQLTGKHTDAVIKLHKAEQAAADYEAKYAGTSEYSATKMQELTDAVTAAQVEVDQYNSEIAQTRDALADASDAVDFYYGKITESSRTGGEEIGKGLSDGIDKGLSDSKTGVPKKTKDIIEGAITEADKATAGAYSVGEHLGQGLIDGIKSKAYLVRDAAAYAMTHGLTGFTVTAEIASPSKVTRRYGQYLDEGAALGVTQNAGIIEDATALSAERALASMESVFSESRIPFPALASGRIIPTMASLSAASNQSAFGSAGLENTLKSVLSDFMRSKTYQVSAKANARTIFELVIDEGRRQFASTGRNAFELSTLG